MFVIAIATMFHAPLHSFPIPGPSSHNWASRKKKANNRIRLGSCHSLGPCNDWQKFWMKGIGKTNTRSVAVTLVKEDSKVPVKGCSIISIVTERSLGGQKSIASPVLCLYFA